MMRGVASPTVEQVVDVIVRLLAEERGESEADVRDDLEEGGWEMPIDSLRIVEILTKVEAEFGVEVPAGVDSARSMRSVHAFADVVRAAISAGDRSPT
jgi:acyl carrier protein